MFFKIAALLKQTWRYSTMFSWLYSHRRHNSIDLVLDMQCLEFVPTMQWVWLNIPCGIFLNGGRGEVAPFKFFFFLLLETRDFGSSACAASSPSAKMPARERHLQESLFPINKCVHVLSHRRRRGWRPRGRRGQKRGILEWGNWSGSRKRYAAPAVTRLSSTMFVFMFVCFFPRQVEWTEFIWLRQECSRHHKSSGN